MVQKRHERPTGNGRRTDLVREACISGHDNAPSAASGGHGRHVEALPPLLVDPLEGEGVADLVRLLRVRRAWRAETGALKEAGVSKSRSFGMSRKLLSGFILRLGGRTS